MNLFNKFLQVSFFVFLMESDIRTVIDRIPKDIQNNDEKSLYQNTDIYWVIVCLLKKQMRNSKSVYCVV